MFRTEKDRFFKAVVKEIDSTSVPMKILFHFLKTSSYADEWAEYGSDKIRPYKSAVPPTVREQKKLLENEQMKNHLILSSNPTRPGDEMKQGNLQFGALAKSHPVSAAEVGMPPDTIFNKAPVRSVVPSGLCAIQKIASQTSNSNIPSQIAGSEAIVQSSGNVQSTASIVSATSTSPPITEKYSDRAGTVFSGEPRLHDHAVKSGLQAGNMMQPNNHVMSTVTRESASPHNLMMYSQQEQRETGHHPVRGTAPSVREDIPPIKQAHGRHPYQLHAVDTTTHPPDMTRHHQRRSSNTKGLVPETYSANQQREIRRDVTSAIPQLHQSDITGAAAVAATPPHPTFQANRQHVHYPNPACAAPPTYHEANHYHLNRTLSNGQSWQQSHRPNLTNSVPPVYPGHPHPNAHHANPAGSAVEAPVASHHGAQGFQTIQAGPRQMVPQLSGRPTGMPPPVICDQIAYCASNSSTQEKPVVQRPRSGLDVLAMIGARLEKAAEEQPHLTPEQALQQYMQSHR